MSSLSWMHERSLMKRGVVLTTLDDTVAGSGPVALRLKYIGGGSVTSVTITTATNLVLVSVGSDSVSHTDTYAFATYDTMGKLAAKINSDGRFQARVLDTLSSNATASSLTRSGGTDGALTAVWKNGEYVYDVLVDTSAALFAARCLAYDRGFLKPNKILHRVHLTSINYKWDVGTVDYVYVYERDASGNETLLYKFPDVDNTDTTITWASGLGYITSFDNCELVVIVAGNTTFANGGYLNVIGEIE